MDNSHLDHSHMDHSHQIFTWDTTNLCIVFRSWRITGFGSLLVSLLAIVALSAGYEAIKEAARQYEARSAPSAAKDTRVGSSGGLQAGRNQDKQAQLIKAVFYGAQVFYSFFIMLIFMTYNGWVMIAVAVGATVGHLLFGASSSSAKSAACH